MSNKSKNLPEHDEVMSMLPWFVNQTLESSKRERVSEHIDQCEHCQQEIKLLVAMNTQIKNDAQQNYSGHTDVDRDFANVMKRIDASSQQSASVDFASIELKLREKLNEFIEFATARSGMKWSATALAGLLVAVLGFQLFNSYPDNDYSVLSSSDIADSPMQLSVEISSTADAERARASIQAELEKMGQQITIDSTTETVSVVGFRQSLDIEELSNIIFKIENLEFIKKVEILPNSGQ